MVKAIITDLDDTLLRRDKTVSKFTARTLGQCREKGVKLMLATARGESANRLVPFEWFDGRVLMNGAMAMAEDRVIFRRRMAPEAYVPFLMAMDREGIRAAAEIGGVHCANFHVPDREYAITPFGSLKEPAGKLYAIVDTAEKAERVRKALPNGLCAHFTKDHYAIVTHAQAKKANGIAALRQHWGIAFSETVAFGDDANDKDMLAQCGIGVALGNALEEVKGIANAVCGDCDDDGVARWLAGPGAILDCP